MMPVEVEMTNYGVDRAMLESLSTEEILRILKEQRDDYTAPAIEIFEEILAERGVHQGESTLRAQGTGSGASTGFTGPAADVWIRNPGDAVRVLNNVLGEVLNGTIEPQAAQAATSVVMGILHALEQQYMTGSDEDE